MLTTLSRVGGDIAATKALESAMSVKRTSKGAASETAAKLGGWIRASFAGQGNVAPADAEGSWRRW